MKRTLIALALVAAAAGACQKHDAPPPSGPAEAASDDDASTTAAEPGRQAAPASLSLDLPSLAYTYGFSLEAPARSIPEMMRRHEQLCIDSGPAQCQVLGSDLTSEGRDEARGRLELRATQAWVRMFRPTLDTDAHEAGGELTTAGTDSEDLTRTISDTDAALKSKIAVRDRLREMLERPGRLDDARQISADLERVQEEIDAARSSLNQLNTRVDASRITVEYRSIAPLAPESAFKPFRGASGAFVRTFMGVLAGLAWFAAVALPFVIVFGPVVWLVASRRRRPAPAAE